MTSDPTYSINFSPKAEVDIEEIGNFIALHNPTRAVSFVAELRAACIKIARRPHAYRVRREVGPSIRSVAHGRYIIFFSIDGTTVRVARVLHAARDLARQFARD